MSQQLSLNRGPSLPGMQSSPFGDGPGTDFHPSYLYPPAVPIKHRQVERPSELGVPAGICAAGQSLLLEGGVEGGSLVSLALLVSSRYTTPQHLFLFFVLNECLN